MSPGGGEGAVTATASGNPDDAPGICTGMGKNIWTTSVQGLTAGQAVNPPSRGDAAWGAGHPGRFPSPFLDELRWEGENLPAARDPGGSTCRGSPGSRRYRLQHVAWEAVSWLRAPKLIIRVPAHGLRLCQRRGASSERSAAPPPGTPLPSPPYPAGCRSTPRWVRWGLPGVTSPNFGGVGSVCGFARQVGTWRKGTWRKGTLKVASGGVPCVARGRGANAVPRDGQRGASLTPT